MALLKEDGSLDIERINALPLEEYKEVIGSLIGRISSNLKHLLVVIVMVNLLFYILKI